MNLKVDLLYAKLFAVIAQIRHILQKEIHKRIMAHIQLMYS